MAIWAAEQKRNADRAAIAAAAQIGCKLLAALALAAFIKDDDIAGAEPRDEPCRLFG
jgi:hypothetical protein